MKRSVWILALLALAGCATQTEWVTFPISAGGKGMTLQAWLNEHPLKPGQDVGIEELSRGQTASAAIVQIRKHQGLHYHKDHDVIVILLRGRGTLTVGDRRLEIRPGSIVTIPRGIAHSLLNKSQQPAVAYAMFNPPFDGTDVVPVAEDSLVKTQKK